MQHSATRGTKLGEVIDALTGAPGAPAATMLAHASSTDIVRVQIPSGGRFDEPISDEEQVVICLQGSIRLCLGERTCDLRAGQIVIAAAGEPCGVTGLEDATLLLLVPRSPRSPDEVVQEASEESFPASDAPAWTGTTGS